MSDKVYDPLADEIMSRAMQRERRQRIPDSLRRPTTLAAAVAPEAPVQPKACTTPECACKRSLAEDLMGAAAKVRTVLSRAARSRTTNK